LKLVESVEIKEVEGQGFILSHKSGDEFIKLGTSFEGILPLLKNGCDRSNLIDVLVAQGLDMISAKIQLDQILVQFEENGLIEGSSYTPKQKSKHHLTYETSLFNTPIKHISYSLPSGYILAIIFGPVAVTVYIYLSALLWTTSSSNPRITPTAYGIVITVLIIFLWLLLHEISHGVIAMKNKCRIKSIGLRIRRTSFFSIYPFCRMEEADILFDKKAHVRILLAGPAFDILAMGLLLTGFYLFPDINPNLKHLLLFAGTSIILINTNLFYGSDLKHAFLLWSQIINANRRQKAWIYIPFGIAYLILFSLYVLLFFSIIHQQFE